MKRNLILTALVLLSLHCSAQYAWKNFNTSNSGMLSNNMSSLWVTKDNVLWAAYVGVGGNGLGVVKYDGKTWTNFDTTNSGLPNNDIRAITSDQQGNVWFGCYNAGLVKYDGTAWTLFTEANSELPHNNVTTLTVDATGHLWVGMYFGGVSEFDGTTWTHFNHSNAPFPDTNCINDILVDKNMTLWVGMDCQGGLARRDTNGTWTSYTAENSLIPNHTVTAIHAGVDHEVWLGFLTKQVSWFDGTTFTNYTLPAGVAFDGFSQDIRGNWWCGTTTAGLFRFDAGESPGPWEAENIPGTVSNVSIFSQSVGIGPDGEVWWGEQNNGLWKRERTGPYAWIPDANFRSCLKEAHPFAFTDADSLILAETPNITLIDCANRSITDLTGVEHFTDLISLLVDQNPLTTIPSLSGLSHLVSLTCRQTGMTTLPDLSGCHELMVLIAGSNHLSAFPDLTANPKLQSLDLGDNDIPLVPDLSYLPELQWLFLSNNPITILPDLSPNDKLKALLIGGLQITEAPDLSALHNLETIDINDNNLTVFPAVNNTSLKVVIAYDNDFTELPD
ncbi:MAG TPA: two-component regulator propeller domain-containing protein, partial [Ohtaekwangia sp.]